MSLENRIKSALTDIATDWKSTKTWLFGSINGSLADLNTVDKTSVVGAINELEAATVTVPDATESVEGVAEIATLAEMATGTSHENKFATPAGVRQERDALKSELLGGASAAWDTLEELRIAIEAAEETDAIDALTTVVGTKANAADVWTKTEIGAVEADLAAYYQAAKA